MTDKKVGIAVLNNPGANFKYSIDTCRDLIIEAMLSAGYGKKDKENSFLDIIKPNDIVLLKPNWVVDYNYSGLGTESLITHPDFIYATVREISRCNPGKIIIGDAPIQGCKFSKLVPQNWNKEISTLSKCPVEFIDFRRTILDRSQTQLSKRENVREIENYILFDLKEKSLLEAVSTGKNRFRVIMYDHRLLNKRHRHGTHQYLIAKEIFDSNVIINMPKLKTHKKTGLTGALKNIVGINGNKEFLPHHRVGGSLSGGDCYPGRSTLKRISEFFSDLSNRKIEEISSRLFQILSRLFFGLAKKIGSNDQIEGGWYGNDTIWRTVLDLNSILLYGKPDGTMAQEKQRTVFHLTDAIISGDTEGPLSVEPVDLGAVTFCSSPVFADLIHSVLMKFDWNKIPIIKKAFTLEYFPLTPFCAEECEVVVNRKKLNLNELETRFAKHFRATKSWKGHIENKLTAK